MTETRNYIENGNFETGSGVPSGWEIVCPIPALAPLFKLSTDAAGVPGLVARGNGRRECLGYVRQRLRLEGGKAYRLAVRFRPDGLKDVNLHLVHGIFDTDYKFNEGIVAYRRNADGTVTGEQRFPGPGQANDVEVRLYFRYSADGQVCWHNVSLEQCEPIPPRLVTVACREGALPQGAGMSYWETWLDRAGAAKAGVALLPETFNGRTPRQPEPLDGPSAQLLAAKAKRWGMYSCGTFYAKRADLVYNTALLFDRSGTPAGSYEKNFVYDPELDEGVTPGSGFGVFEADFGRVGIMICYDSWFPEAARLLAWKGAELVLFPNAGYYADLMPARAADNGIWIAASSLNGPAGIWDSSGGRAGEAQPSPIRDCPSTIVSYDVDSAYGMLTATLDLSRVYSPGWHGGPMQSAPGARPYGGPAWSPSKPP